MNDFHLMAEVFDGGVGDHPKLLAACQAHSRQMNAEYERRRGSWGPVDSMPVGSMYNRVSEFVMERIRVTRAYGN